MQKEQLLRGPVFFAQQNNQKWAQNHFCNAALPFYQNIRTSDSTVTIQLRNCARRLFGMLFKCAYLNFSSLNAKLSVQWGNLFLFCVKWVIKSKWTLFFHKWCMVSETFIIAECDNGMLLPFIRLKCEKITVESVLGMTCGQKYNKTIYHGLREGNISS